MQFSGNNSMFLSTGLHTFGIAGAIALGGSVGFLYGASVHKYSAAEKSRACPQLCAAAAPGRPVTFKYSASIWRLRKYITINNRQKI
jgi:hypothetical protein